jgi:hypothetical protein
MTQASHWTLQTFCLLFLNIGLEATVLTFLLRGRVLSELVMLRIFAAWLLLSDLAVFGVALVATDQHTYWLAYWSAQILSNFLTCLLAAEIATHVMNWKTVALAWCFALVLVLLLATNETVPAVRTEQMLNLSITCEMATGLVLAGLLLFPHTWRQGYCVIVGGIVCNIGPAAYLHSQWLQDRLASFAAVKFGIPLASAVSLGLFALAAADGSRVFDEPRRR